MNDTCEFEKVSQKVEHLLKSGSKKWSTFPKSESKSGAPFKKWLQKVEYFSEK